MKYTKITIPDDINTVKEIATLAFSSTPDSTIKDWFSFDVMEKNIAHSEGVCIKAIDEKNNIIGVIYAQQENPINGIEGIEKWVIILSAVHPKATGKGIGSGLLNALEKYARKINIKKMFAFTNKGDTQVINFYKKNGYKDAGWIKDYQYGKNNSAVFLLKYL